jgi:hypothetical protein
MAEAIRLDCDPVAFSLGFRHPRRGNWDRWLTTSRNVYIRWRGEHYDEVILQWARYGEAWFRVDISSSTVVAWSDGHTDSPSRSVRFARGDAWAGPLAPLCRDKFGPWRSIPSVVDVFNRCLAELDLYVREDAPGPHIGARGVYTVSPSAHPNWLTRLDRDWGDPRRDPERDIAG